MRFGPPLCRACFGGECRGGEHVWCLQRETQASCIVGILEMFGTTRVVVEQEAAIKSHVFLGEYACVSPVRTRQPIAWDDQARVIALGEAAIQDWIVANQHSNDADVRATIHAWRYRQLLHPQSRGSLDTSKIVFA